MESFATLNVLLDSSRDIKPRDSAINFRTLSVNNPLNNVSSILTMRSAKTKFGAGGTGMSEYK